MPPPAALLLLALLLPPPPPARATESETETGARGLRLETLVAPPRGAARSCRRRGTRCTSTTRAAWKMGASSTPR
ncbi:unnamed protein product [Bubo scandiacus]